VIEDVAMLVGADVGVEQPKLAVFHQSVGILEVDLPFAGRLDLGAGEDDAGLEFLQQEVIVGGGAIAGDVAFGGLAGLGRRRHVGPSTYLKAFTLPPKTLYPNTRNRIVR
jgi:hypothetical protein